MSETVEGKATTVGGIRQNMATVEFSVVIPLYNKREFIRRTLESVMAQTLRPREIIVVDDGSSDGGPEAITDLLPDCVTLVRQANAGPGLARNHGAAIASGDWIALIDADDLWHPRHLENLAGVVAAFPDVDVVAAASQQQTLGDVGAQLNLATELGDAQPHRLDYFRDPEYHLVHTSSIAIRRTAYATSGGFGPYFPGEDPEFWARLALDHRFALSPVPTSIYVRGTGGLMDTYATRFGNDVVMRDLAFFSAMMGGALGNERYSARHRDIAGFADRTMLESAKNLLYVGNGTGVRYALGLLHHAGSTPIARVFRWLSYLPATMLVTGARTYSWLKRRT